MRRRTFSGGYEFRGFEGQPQDRLIEIGIPEKVTVPLRQGFGNEVVPVVRVGQKVAAGQIIGRDDESVSSPVHSSVNGKVVGIEAINNLGEEVNAVVIESDGTADWQGLQGHSSSWESLSGERIDELVYLSGAGSLGRAGIPTRFRSSIIGPEDVENVIVHGVESEVHGPSLAILLRDENLSHFVEGLKILKRVMSNAAFHLALNKSRKNIIEQLSGLLADDDRVEICGLRRKYPVDYDEVLIATLLGREFPYGYSAANIGVIVLDVQTVLHVYEAVAEGNPLIERTVALCGPGFRENLHVKVRIGTSAEYVIRGKTEEGKEVRFVRNSSLAGTGLSDLSLPIDRTFSALIALLEGREREFLAFVRPGFRRDSYSRTFLSSLFSKGCEIFKKSCGTNLHGEERPCIFCTYCEEVCPVGIVPHLLYHYVERDVIDEGLLNLKIFNCIECNLCSYVCPSKIPVAKYIREGKEKLMNEGIGCGLPDLALKGVEEYKSVQQPPNKFGG